MEEEGFYTPDFYYPFTPLGIWDAQFLLRFIRKMGYEAEFALDPVEVKGGTFFHVLHVGKIPQAFMEDIKDFISGYEISNSRDGTCPKVVNNGVFKHNAETAMMRAFRELESQKRKDSGNGGVVRHVPPQP